MLLVFGLPKAVECYSGRHGGADIDVEDTAVMTLVYEDFPATLQLCFMQQKNRRSIRVAGTEGYLEWSDEDDKLFHHDYKSGNIEDHKEANPFPFEQMFLDQTKYFLSEFDQSDTRAYLNSAIASQLIIDAAKKSTQSGKMINIPIGAEGL